MLEQKVSEKQVAGAYMDYFSAVFSTISNINSLLATRIPISGSPYLPLSFATPAPFALLKSALRRVSRDCLSTAFNKIALPGNDLSFVNLFSRVLEPWPLVKAFISVFPRTRTKGEEGKTKTEQIRKDERGEKREKKGKK